jgi:hemolysin activation/secretion protein
VADSGALGNFRLALDWTAHRLFNRGNLVPVRPRLNHSQGSFEARRMVPVSRTVALQIIGGAGGTLIRSEFVPPDLRFRVGGVHSLRGYSEEQFLTDNFLRVAAELHYGTVSQSLFLFGDSGWLSFPQQSDRILFSVGAGLNIAQRLLLMFAVPGDGGLDQAKIHIALSSGT